MEEVRVEDIDASMLERLKARAAAHRRSLAEEVRAIVVDSVEACSTPLSIDEFLKRTEGIRRRTACCAQTDSAILVREDRDQ